MEAIRKHFDLGFTLPYQLGPATYGFEVLAWITLALGMFLRQGLELPHLAWNTGNLNVASFLAALAVALAVFPPMMRWFNRRRRKPGLAHLALPFAFGFFLDLAAVAAARIIAQ